MAQYPELKNKSVVVTGAGRGIGLAIAKRFVVEGARVLLGDIAGGDSASVVTLAEESGTQAAYQVLDVTCHEQVDAAIATLFRDGAMVFATNGTRVHHIERKRLRPDRFGL